MVTLPKTRIIPISDFYSRLQLEYLCYKFRAMIYHRQFDKKKFQEIAIMKKQKIEQIALENRLPSVFNNKEQQKKYLLRFFGECGIPLFSYRDEYQEAVKGRWDLFYYFITGASIRLLINGQIEIGTIVSADISQKTIVVEINEKRIQAVFSEITRIFPSNFYEALFE